MARPQTKTADISVDDIALMEPDLITDELKDVGTHEGVDTCVSRDTIYP